MNFRESIINAELWQPEVARCWKFFWEIFALKKRPLAAKFSKFCSNRIHRLIDQRVVFKFHEIWKTEKRLNCALLTWQKNFAWLSRSRYCADHDQNLPGPARTMYSDCSRFHPNWLTFSKVILEHVNTVKIGRKVNPVFGWSLALSKI